MEAKTPVHQKPFNPDELIMSQKAAMKAYGPEGGKAWQPLYDSIKDTVMSNPKSTKADAYKAALSQYPAIREEMMASLEKSLSSGKLNPLEEKQLRATYNAVSYDKTGEHVLGNGVFQNTARSMKMEEENSKAAIEALKQEGKSPKSIERTVDLGDKVEYIYFDGTREIKAKGKLPGSGEDSVAKVTKQEALARRIEKEAADQARKEAFVKFNIVPEFVQGADGSLAPKWPVGRPEVFQYYEAKKNELTKKNTSRAIKQGALSKDYMTEEPSGAVPKETPAPEKRQLVKDKDGNYVWK
jgi:hypothetical protein